MSHALNIHDGLGIIARDPALGILHAYGSTVPAAATEGYAPGCLFIKTNGTTYANVAYINVGTKASSSFVVAIVSSSATGSIAVAGAITAGGTSTGTLGYEAGSGASVTQATDRTTGVTINKPSGKITTQATSLAAQTSVAFTVTNSSVAISDVIILSIRSGPTGLKTIATVTTVAAGSFQINLFNTDAATADTAAAIINFAVIKGGAV